MCNSKVRDCCQKLTCPYAEQTQPTCHLPPGLPLLVCRISLLDLPPYSVQSYLNTSSSRTQLFPTAMSARREAVAVFYGHIARSTMLADRSLHKCLSKDRMNWWTSESTKFGLICIRTDSKIRISYLFWALSTFWNECIPIQRDCWKKFSLAV